MSSIDDIVIDIVAGQFRLKRNEVNLNTKFVDDLGADSLDLVDLIMTIEEEFKIDIPDDKAEMFYDIQDIVSYIKEHKGK